MLCFALCCTVNTRNTTQLHSSLRLRFASFSVELNSTSPQPDNPIDHFYFLQQKRTSKDLTYVRVVLFVRWGGNLRPLIVNRSGCDISTATILWTWSRNRRKYLNPTVQGKYITWEMQQRDQQNLTVIGPINHKQFWYLSRSWFSDSEWLLMLVGEYVGLRVQ